MTLLIICAYFMKDKSLEDNAAFLQKSYGTNGAGLFIHDREYAIWYDADGIRVSTGRTVQKRYTTFVTWEQAAKRIRELLDLGQYMPQSELDRVQDFERMELAKSLIYARREFSDEARDAGYLPLTTLTYSAKGGFPETEKQMQHLLEDSDTLSQLVDEWTLFAAVYEKDRSLLRSRWYDPVALLRRLEDLQREPLVFTAADGYDPQRRFFISDDEIDRVLRGSERSYESRLDTFSFFSPPFPFLPGRSPNGNASPLRRCSRRFPRNSAAISALLTWSWAMAQPARSMPPMLPPSEC